MLGLVATTALAQEAPPSSAPPSPPPVSAPPSSGPTPPTQEALTTAVHRYVSPHLDATACQPPTTAANGELRYECRETECPGACQVVEHIVVLGYRRGRFRRISERREHRGDTGACGCCIDGYE